MGVWASPTPPHIPVLLSQLIFFQWIHKQEKCIRDFEGIIPNEYYEDGSIGFHGGISLPTKKVQVT